MVIPDLDSSACAGPILRGVLRQGCRDRSQPNDPPQPWCAKARRELTALKDGETTRGGYETKPRDEHRHHAVDAVAIAFTSSATTKQPSEAAQPAPFERHDHQCSKTSGR